MPTVTLSVEVNELKVSKEQRFGETYLFTRVVRYFSLDRFPINEFHKNTPDVVGRVLCPELELNEKLLEFDSNCDSEYK